jgi:PhoH-like ATPase
MKKNFVLDTNVLISDPNCLNAFDDNDVYVPLVVIEELDKLKSRQDEVGANARNISRKLDDLRASGSLFKGVKLGSGGMLSIIPCDVSVDSALPTELQSSKADNLIVACALSLNSKMQNVVLISKDVNVRLKCDVLGVVAQDYLNMRIAQDSSMFYKGVSVTTVDRTLLNKIHIDGEIPFDSVKQSCDETVYPNQIVVIKSHDDGISSVGSALTRKIGDRLVKIGKNVENVFGLSPKNKEQRFAMDLLLDPNVQLVTLTGMPGSGKTLMSIAAGLEQLRSLGSTPVYDKFIVSRPIQPMGKDIGFLPGTLQEKMDPWLAPIKDNLEFLFGKSKKVYNRPNNKGSRDGSQEHRVSNNPYLDLMQEKGLLEIEAITYIRGRSIPRAIILIDEAQNLSMHEIKTIVTRAGEGSKVIVTGDIGQIDNCHVDIYTNGLTYIIEKFKDQEIAGHVALKKGERSALATIASDIL